METSELLKKVRKIEIKTKGLSSQIFSGEYHSAFKGRGMTFSEVREYQHNDDIRFIDWNVTARFNHPFVKVFHEERELVVILLVDVSASGIFGSKGMLKKDLITELCAVLSFSAITNNDKIGVIFFSDTIEKFIPPKKGKSHILRIIRELLNFEPSSNKTNISQALQYLSQVIKKRSISFVISDFIDRNYEKELRLAARRHDLVAVRLSDVIDKEIPDLGLSKFIDPESGKTMWVDLSDDQNRMLYKKIALQQKQMQDEWFLKSGVDCVDLMTHENYVQPLMNFFKKRMSAR
ncbi:MAG TPA: DUF58 domain-containing protein [Bacteroidia bacterium]|nr:DUF58 domain-containing protein [Bacteroidia bacterium]HNT80913.1 DUF58 domain-containing protein [Bacteroidia bacterium]